MKKKYDENQPLTKFYILTTKVC